MSKIAFDNALYLKIQRDAILKRIKDFDNKLYLEVGGKFFDDYHACRVLPGFKLDSKVKMLSGLKDKAEILIVVNTKDINATKVRNDTGITYQAEVERLIDSFKDSGFYVPSVVFSFYEHSALVDIFVNKLKKNGINVYRLYNIEGYPHDVAKVVSKEGFGKNDYIKTTRPLVVVTAPGPGSGKMATCLSQLYFDSKNGIRAGYAKYETFPIYNLSIDHPLNVAYEAATVDLNDVNMLDPYHLAAYNKIAVNYNRDIEVFPLLKAIFEKIYVKSPYNSPTDMGINMVGFAIKNEEVAIQASKDEVIRRYFQVKKNNFLGKFNDESVDRIELLMKRLSLSVNDRKCVKYALLKEQKTSKAILAIELKNGKIITGKQSEIFSSAAALILNALKSLAKIDDNIPLITPNVIEPILALKSSGINAESTYLNAEEVLIALAIQAPTNSLSSLALKQLGKLKGCQAHSSVLLSKSDLDTLKKFGIDVTEQAKQLVRKLYLK